MKTNIFLINCDKMLFSEFKTSSFKEAFGYLKNQPILGIDIETTRKFGGKYGKQEGLDPYLTETVMLQIGTVDKQFIIDIRKSKKEDVTLLMRMLVDRGITFVGHNLKFEIKHILHKNGVRLEKVLDTMILENMIYSGIKKPMDLNSLNERYLKLRVDKDIRMSFLTIGSKAFNIDQIEYGARDILYPLMFFRTQVQKLHGFNMQKCIDLEMKFLPVLAELELTGFKINKNDWLEVAKVNKIRYRKQFEILTSMLIEVLPSDSKFVNQQLDFFNTERTLTFKFSSSKKVIELFSSFGINAETTDKKSKKLKKTVESKILKSYLIINESSIDERYIKIAKEYLILKEYEQACTTFGDKFAEKYIHPITGRLHSSFKQILTTGRISSSSPNIQNIPSAPEFRKCFDSEEGGTLINADYSGQENYVLVNQP